jgi:hypothetical protein
MRLRLVCVSVALAAGAYACSGNPSSSGDGGTDSSAGDSASDVAQDVVMEAAGPEMVTFSYTPQWTTVSAVSVYGGFGQSTDWTMPFLTLTAGTNGTFSGTSMLPAGQYLYVFKVVGDDAAGAMKTTFNRFAIDPTNPGYLACPMASPTYDPNNPNPCSQLTVPQPTAPALIHVTGTVVSAAAPIADYLVEIERNEMSSHHFFANRLTTTSNGTFDLMAAPGTYRLQVLCPTYYSETDLQRDPPTTLAALRRDISSSFTFDSTPIDTPNAEVAFTTYATFTPTVTGTLPTSFTFGAGTTPTHLEVYGTGMDGGNPTIGDPWYTSGTTMTGAATFDGGFNTAQATEKSVALGERYFWGVEEDIASDAGVSWTTQSMVFDITWH